MKFRKFAATSQGQKYLAKNWNCQDSSATLEFGNVQVAAVADGHGGGNYFRSEFGSKLAVEVLFEQVKIFCNDLKSFERLTDTGIKKFKFDLVSEWRNAVKKDWLQRLSGGELGAGEIRFESVSEKYKARYTSENPQIVEKYLYTAYGTTLICAISTGAQILILQIGDGSCVVLQKNGEFKSPVPPDEENFLNVTASICDDKAELKIRHAILDCDNFSQNSPVAIFLSTDGLDDCFPYFQNAEHLYKFYGGVLIENILEAGFDATENEIKSELLAGLSKKASQDDISLAYFLPLNIENLREVYKKIDANYKSENPVAEIKPAEKIEPVKEIKPVKKFEPETISSQEKILDLIPPFKETKSYLPPSKNIFKANEISITAPVTLPAAKKNNEGKAI